MCSECGSDVSNRDDKIGFLELRGPRSITSSNLDRIFDDGGRRFLVVEEKEFGESLGAGQRALLYALARLREVTVLLVEGTPDELQVLMLCPPDPGVRLLAEGGFAEYQRIIDAWYAGQL